MSTAKVFMRGQLTHSRVVAPRVQHVWVVQQRVVGHVVAGRVAHGRVRQRPADVPVLLGPLAGKVRHPGGEATIVGVLFCCVKTKRKKQYRVENHNNFRCNLSWMKRNSKYEQLSNIQIHRTKRTDHILNPSSCCPSLLICRPSPGQISSPALLHSRAEKYQQQKNKH